MAGRRAAAKRADGAAAVRLLSAGPGASRPTAFLTLKVFLPGMPARRYRLETILTEDNISRIPAEVQTRLAEQQASKRLRTPDDVARVALFLVDREQSGWFTGVVLDVDGGAQIA